MHLLLGYKGKPSVFSVALLVQQQVLLQQLVGPRVAGELMYTAEWIPAARALELGLATAVHGDDGVLEVALRGQSDTELVLFDLPPHRA